MSIPGTWKFSQDWGCKGKYDPQFTITFKEAVNPKNWGGFTSTSWSGKTSIGRWALINGTLLMNYIPTYPSLVFTGTVNGNTVSGVFWHGDAALQPNNSGCFRGVKVTPTTASAAKAKASSKKQSAKKASKKSAAKKRSTKGR